MPIKNETPFSSRIDPKNKPTLTKEYVRQAKTLQYLKMAIVFSIVIFTIILVVLLWQNPVRTSNGLLFLDGGTPQIGDTVIFGDYELSENFFINSLERIRKIFVIQEVTEGVVYKGPHGVIIETDRGLAITDYLLGGYDNHRIYLENEPDEFPFYLENMYIIEVEYRKGDFEYWLITGGQIRGIVK